MLRCFSNACALEEGGKEGIRHLPLSPFFSDRAEQAKLSQPELPGQPWSCSEGPFDLEAPVLHLVPKMQGAELGSPGGTILPHTDPDNPRMDHLPGPWAGETSQFYLFLTDAEVQLETLREK